MPDSCGTFRTEVFGSVIGTSSGSFSSGLLGIFSGLVVVGGIAVDASADVTSATDFTVVTDEDMVGRGVVSVKDGTAVFKGLIEGKSVKTEVATTGAIVLVFVVVIVTGSCVTVTVVVDVVVLEVRVGAAEIVTVDKVAGIGGRVAAGIMGDRVVWSVEDGRFVAGIMCDAVVCLTTVVLGGMVVVRMVGKMREVVVVATISGFASFPSSALTSDVAMADSVIGSSILVPLT